MLWKLIGLQQGVAIDISYLQNCLLVSAKIAVQCTVIVKRFLTSGPLPGDQTVLETPSETRTVSAIIDMSSEHQAKKIYDISDASAVRDGDRVTQKLNTIELINNLFVHTSN